MRVAIGAFAILLALLVGGAAYLLVEACALRLPLSGRVVTFCPVEQADTSEAALRRQIAENRAIEADIAGLERDLAGQVCRAAPPPPPEPPPRPPERPKVTETPSGLAPDAFEDDDISVMEGCWELSSRYDVRHIRTGDIISFRDWAICFDGQGNGRETMRATNGLTCEGELYGRIDGGKLSMREPGNLQCANGFEIFRRDITCTLNAAGVANCSTYQPEIDGRGRATLKRAGR